MRGSNVGTRIEQVGILDCSSLIAAWSERGPAPFASGSAVSAYS